MTNQASEVKRNSLNKSDIDVKLESIIRGCIDDPHDRTIGEAKAAIQSIIRNEKLKLLDEVIHQSTVNLKSAKAVAGWAELRKEQLEAEL